MKRFLTGLFGVLMVSGMAVSAAGAPAPQDAAKIEAGKKVYDAQKCMTCHAIAGKGMKAYPLDGVGAKLTAADIKNWIVTPDAMAAKLAKKPAMKMKAYTTLPAADLDALVAYLSSLKK